MKNIYILIVIILIFGCGYREGDVEMKGLGINYKGNSLLLNIDLNENIRNANVYLVTGQVKFVSLTNDELAIMVGLRHDVGELHMISLHINREDSNIPIRDILKYIPEDGMDVECVFNNNEFCGIIPSRSGRKDGTFIK